MRRLLRRAWVAVTWPLRRSRRAEVLARAELIRIEADRRTPPAGGAS
jgi:hypothetical protein